MKHAVKAREYAIIKLISVEVYIIMKIGIGYAFIKR